MCNSRSILTVAVFVALVAIPLLAGSKPAPDVPIVSTVYDAGYDVPFTIQSDGGGPYMTGPGISSIIQGASGDWVLDTAWTGPDSGRRIRFYLSEPASSSSIGTTAFTGTRFIAQCHVNSADFRTMKTTDAPHLCPLIASRLTNDGGITTYRLAQNPPVQNGTSWVKVTCEVDRLDNSGCQQWLLEPFGPTRTGTDPNYKNIGRLIKEGTKNNPDTPVGDFYVSFAIRLKRQ